MCWVSSLIHPMEAARVNKRDLPNLPSMYSWIGPRGLENIVKKRKTAEEDKAFYDHKLQQGGSSV
eukprot:scaffold3909_cov138-Skeletonema_marinoi.AAC.3